MAAGIGHRHRTGVLTVALFALVGVDAHPSGAQDRVTVVGRLVLGVDSLPVPGAHVAVAGVAPVRTDSTGRFVLEAPAGDQRFTAVVVGPVRERIFTALFRVPAREEVRFTWWVGSLLDPATTGVDPLPVEGFRVTVDPARPEALNRSAERADVLDRAAIEALAPEARSAGDLVRRMVGVRVESSEDGTVCIVPNRGRSQHRAISSNLALGDRLDGPRPRGCPEMVTVVLDGLVLRDAAHFIAALPPGDIETIRYVGAITATQLYGRDGRWGALVIETRRR